MGKGRESGLYAPVKRWLEAKGFEVKGEVGPADVMAMPPDGGDPVLIELKTGFTLSLVQQGIARLAVSDAVYLAVPKPKKGRKAVAADVALCRRLGLGLIHVRAGDGFVEVLCDPGPYVPRKSARKKGRLLREFARRVGDPNDGGATRHGIVTSYRQDALRCARYLAETGPERGAVIARAAGVPAATRIMRDDHYGWFRRVERGVYDLSEAGRRGLADWGDA
ncbi:DUF2161 domain-containing phosphodiesterase [Pseudooceanicola nanhaiensis]|jgi:hypothetical protein|uniref:Uncharacterized protein n=2 Tax=Pseudooceanicola nanhaiensis TaxID=375761 RepID=A0A917WDE8_9RHOB|nr:DUF2161 family putative PD-(D/E)XK-type phosphodiesterase [Pseudooceanicola nanhaiensis]GGL94944.1 hypothetical protein GCM10011534_16420 [Pseudooceanicola nanhaiensis]